MEPLPHSQELPQSSHTPQELIQTEDRGLEEEPCPGPPGRVEGQRQGAGDSRRKQMCPGSHCVLQQPAWQPLLEELDSWFFEDLLYISPGDLVTK